MICSVGHIVLTYDGAVRALRFRSPEAAKAWVAGSGLDRIRADVFVKNHDKRGVIRSYLDRHLSNV